MWIKILQKHEKTESLSEGRSCGDAGSCGGRVHTFTMLYHELASPCFYYSCPILTDFTPTPRLWLCDSNTI